MSPPPTVTEQIANDQSRWFSEEVQPHDASLKAYLRGKFPFLRSEVDDVVQESYLRVWQVRARRPIESIKGILFQIARHVIGDLHRRGKINPVMAVGNLTALPDIIEERPSVAESVSTNEKIKLLAEALITLPPVCRKVVMLRKLKGFNRKETATELGISEKTVDEHLSRGLKKLEVRLGAKGVHSLYDA